MSRFHLYITESKSNSTHVVDGALYDVCSESCAQNPYPLEFIADEHLQNDIAFLQEPKVPNGIQSADAHNKICSQIGEKLFRIFVAQFSLVYKDYENYLGQNDYPRIVLHLPPTLYDLPWELLRNPEDPPGRFLCLSGSIIRCDVLLKDPASVSISSRVGGRNFAFIFANPTNQSIDLQIDKIISPENIHLLNVTPASFSKFKDIINDSARGKIKKRYGRRLEWYNFLRTRRIGSSKWNR